MHLNAVTSVPLVSRLHVGDAEGGKKDGWMDITFLQ